VLTISNIDLFINDAYDSIVNNKEIKAFFNSNELYEYKRALQQFYYQFHNKIDYPTYSSIVKYLLNKKIEVRPGWTSMTKINYLKKFPRMNCPNAENAENILINLPSSPQLIK
jgi:dTDP-4-amino-4,6-dideoxygalactose transaminase